MPAHRVGTEPQTRTISLNRATPVQKVWVNPQLAKIEKVQAIIPVSLVFVMRQIEKEVPSVEFGVYLHGDFNGTTLVVSPEYFIPKQTVSTASIDFEEDGHDNGNLKWNGVAHKHPHGCTSFSGTDDDSINGNHQFSLLYENGDFSKGEVNLNVIEMQGRIRLPVTLSYLYPKVEIPSDQLKNIKRHTAPRVSNFGYQGLAGSHYSQYHQNYRSDDSDTPDAIEAMTGRAIHEVEDDPANMSMWEAYLASGQMPPGE